jgi:hypothetical protein
VKGSVSRFVFFMTSEVPAHAARAVGVAMNYGRA